MSFGDIIDAVGTGLANFRFADALDILILTLLIFWLIRFAKKSRAYQLLRGVGLAFVILIISQIFGLTALSWLLDSVLLSGIVFIAIIFQPELRRAFEHLGRGGKLFSRKMEERPSDNIYRAVTKLAKRKVGALIIFERRTALGDISDTGTHLDAIITAELLENIFEPKTPLHDGAVIIRESKIHSAACIIPLTNDMDIAQELGTRHRAAVSISMASDCISLVVSEETGKISYAQDGALYRDLDTQKLLSLLEMIFSNGETDDKNSSGIFGKLFKRKEKDA